MTKEKNRKRPLPLAQSPPEQSLPSVQDSSANEKIMAQARELYVSHVSLGQISRALGVATKTLNKWKLAGNWIDEREANDRSAIEDAFAGRKVKVALLTRLNVDQLERGLEHLRNRADPPSVTEMERLSVILANMDKIMRLDMGQATENLAIQQNIKLSVDQVKEIIANDPFYKVG